MTRKLAHCINKNILVALPSVFGDDGPRSCKLLEIESCGLWLESDEIPSRMDLGKEKIPSGTSITVFVPYAQIAYVLDTTSSAKAAMKAALARATESGARAPSPKKPGTRTKKSERDEKPEKKGRTPKR